MSATAESILAQLKVKKAPVSKSIVPIKYAKQQEAVEISTAVVDKRPVAASILASKSVRTCV